MGRLFHVRLGLTKETISQLLRRTMSYSCLCQLCDPIEDVGDNETQ